MGGSADGAEELLRNGLLMSSCFACNEGALLAVIALSACKQRGRADHLITAAIYVVGVSLLWRSRLRSAALVDAKLSALGNALLYLSFTLGCIPAPAIVRLVGAKRGLVLGTAAYVVYVGAFIFPSYYTVPVIALTAGLFGALLWTAQGVYFSANAKRHCRALAGSDAPPPSHEAEAKSRVRFAGFFAVIFPFGLTAFKVITSLLLIISGHRVPLVYAMLTAAAAAAVVGMSRILDLRDDEDNEFAGPAATGAGSAAARRAASDRALLARGGTAGVAAWAAQALKEVALAHRDRKLLLMLPTNIAFGLCTAFFPYTVTLLVSGAVGSESVGWLYAASGAANGLMALLFARVCEKNLRRGRAAVMTVGAAAFFLITAAVFAATGSDGDGDGDRGSDGAEKHASASLWAALLVLFFGYGTGVAVWQGTCMQLFSDLWRHDPYPAFAALKLQSGAASTVAFFAFPHMSERAAAVPCMLFSLLGLVSYLKAEQLSAAEDGESFALFGGDPGPGVHGRLSPGAGGDQGWDSGRGGGVGVDAAEAPDDEDDESGLLLTSRAGNGSSRGGAAVAAAGEGGASDRRQQQQRTPPSW